MKSGRKHRAAPLWLMVVMLAALAAGCGSGGGSNTADALSRTQLLKQGDAICAKTGARVSKAMNGEAKKLAGKNITVSGEERLVASVTAPAVVQMSEELAALGAPEGEGAEVEAIASDFAAAGHVLEEDPKAGVEEDVFAKASGAAGTYGFRICKQF